MSMNGNAEDLFTIAFDARDEADLIEMWRTTLRSNRWTEGPAVADFEREWSNWNGLPAAAFNSWAGPAWAAMEFFDVRGETVLCPSNTFQATPQSIIAAGGTPVFYDCNRSDLCGSFDDFVRQAEATKPKAAWIVHIGGHIAFDIERIAAYCRDAGIWLAEDCAHAHGAEWYGKKPGSWGDVGIYSFYGTKTISCGEGGIAVSRHADLMQYLKDFREYGKNRAAGPCGMNFRITEFTAALAAVQTRRMPEIIAHKRDYAARILDPIHPNRVRFPDGMQSGYYKYIIFDQIPNSTGKVYEMPCHRIFGDDAAVLPNTDWIATNHACVPIYYPRIERS
jgi:perosamine synthetase